MINLMLSVKKSSVSLLILASIGCMSISAQEKSSHQSQLQNLNRSQKINQSQINAHHKKKPKLSKSEEKKIVKYDTSRVLSPKVLEKLFINRETSKYVITSEHVSSVSGLRHVYMRQAINGIEVMGTESSLHFSKTDEVFKSHSNFVDGIESISNIGKRTLSAEQAISLTAQKMGYGEVSGLVKQTSSVRNEKTAYQERTSFYSKGAISQRDIPVKSLYLYSREEGVKSVWEFSIMDKNSSDWYNFIVDANTGKIIYKHNYTVSCSISENHSEHNHKSTKQTEYNLDNNRNSEITKAATVNKSLVGGGSYHVFAMPTEDPYDGARTIVTNPADFNASPYGWHDTNGVIGAESNYTIGNNCDAYDDSTSTVTGTGSGENTERAFGGAALDFDFTFNDDVSQNGRSIDAAVTNLFYWTNIIHDIFYQYGFDEASGNFQENNYGNGGNGNDSVFAEAQDGSGECNANFGTPADGINPRMQMYTCAGTQDGDYDNVVIVHEYAHGISTRLTGGAAISCLGGQEQMGEGWGDFFGLILTMKPGDIGSDPRAIGNYLMGNGANGDGIRPQLYSTDNTQSYADLGSVSIPHGVGSVWASILWKLNWALIDVYGWDPDNYYGTGGNNIALNLVVEGLKLQPCNPTFITGRDAIIAADEALYGGANAGVIWQVFAEAGVGVGADSGGANVGDETVDSTLPIPTLPKVSFGSASHIITEGSVCGYKDVLIPVNIYVGPSQDTVVTFSIAGGNANSGSDFELLTDTLTFNKGDAAPQEIVVRVHEDSFIESIENAIISFTINNNGGDAGYFVNRCKLILDNDDLDPFFAGVKPIFSDDFESGLGLWTITGAPSPINFDIADNTSFPDAGFFSSDGSNTGFYAFINDDHAGNGYDMSEERMATAPITINKGERHNLAFNYAFANKYGGTASVEISVDNGTTWMPWDNLVGTNADNNIAFQAYQGVVTYNGDLPINYIFSIVFKDGGAWSQGLIVDDVIITELAPLPIQESVNTTTSNALNLRTVGNAYAYDANSGNIMANIDNTNGFNYGCVDVVVSRSGSAAQAFNGSALSYFVMDKVFTITPTNITKDTPTAITFYFTTAEILGWENATGLARANLFAYRLGSSDVIPLTESAYSTDVAFTGSFTGLAGDYYFGPKPAFITSVLPKVYLQGAAMNPNLGEETLMRDDLRVAGFIPTKSPYIDALTTDATVFNITGNNAIVDWLFVELRDANDNTIIISSQSALLQRDGDVVSLDGISGLSFIAPSKDYYVVIKHRNHMSIMSDTPISLTDGVGVVNFTNVVTTTGNNAQTTSNMPTGVFGMWAGNVNSDNQIRYQGSGNDANSIKDAILAQSANTSGSNLYFFSGYHTGDVDLNGIIRYQGSGNDSNIIKDLVLEHPNNESNSNLYSFNKQF